MTTAQIHEFFHYKTALEIKQDVHLSDDSQGNSFLSEKTSMKFQLVERQEINMTLGRTVKRKQSQ